MSAIKFIQQHGVEKAREAIEEASAYGGFWVNAKTLELSNQIPSYDAVSIPDIKRLVASVDLVGKVGGIKRAKSQVEQAHKHGYLTMSIPVEINGSICMGCLYIDKLEQAIADYEAIYSNDIKIEVSFGIPLMSPERLACVDLTPKRAFDLEELRDCDTSPNCKQVNNNES